MSNEIDPPPVHPEALLLPWYVAGTLSEAERAQVTEHLATCSACRMELESVAAIRGGLRAALGDSSAPSPERRDRVHERIAKSRSAATVHQLARRRAWPQFAWGAGAALAASVVALQLAIMMNVVTVRSPADVTTRGVEKPATRIRVLLAPDARARDLGSLLDAIHGRIVDGPAPDGAWIVEVPTVDPARVGEKLEQLRAHAEVIRDAALDRP